MSEYNTGKNSKKGFQNKKNDNNLKKKSNTTHPKSQNILPDSLDSLLLLQQSIGNEAVSLLFRDYSSLSTIPHQGSNTAGRKIPLSDALKKRLEQISGKNLADVKVHLNSDKPGQLNAAAYTQGTNIYIGPGQEKHLPHEAWHVVQQMQGRVNPTGQVDGIMINDNQQLENEASAIGKKVQHLDDRGIQGRKTDLTDNGKNALQLFSGLNTVNASLPGQVVQRTLTDVQRSVVHELFSKAYDLKTFERKNFTQEEYFFNRVIEATAKIKVPGNAAQSNSDELVKSCVEALGDSDAAYYVQKNLKADNEDIAEYINLRHIIPYSDIAGIMYVATSDVITKKINANFSNNVRVQVTQLLELIGSDSVKRKWKEILNTQTDKLLTTDKIRQVIGAIYYELTHSFKNLFYGNAPVNQAIGNRLDVSKKATQVHPVVHIKNLIDWWEKTMSLLELNPKYAEKDVFDTKSKTMVKLPVYEHDLSHKINKAISGEPEEVVK